MAGPNSSFNRLLWVMAGLVVTTSIFVLAQAVADTLESKLNSPPDPAPTIVSATSTGQDAREAPALTDDQARERPSADTVSTPPVLVEVGDELQDLIDRHPEGTTFELARGVHRGISVIPKDGQSFVGEEGAIVSGARELAYGDFEEEDGAWWIGGQTQEGVARGDTLDGFERDQHPEELFVNGDRRLRHVASRAELDEPSWFFDYENDRIWLGANPTQFASIETSVEPFAFGGTGVRDVTIKNLIVEKYASPYQFGAIGGDASSRYTYDWDVIDVVARYNHGAGIILGPGMRVMASRFHHNGQLGMAGNGLHRPDDGTPAYSAQTEVRSTEIDHNLELGFNWNHEGGGTKFSLMDSGMIFENNWVHDNNGPGVWWDIRNKDVIVRGNLAEDNEEMGIFYEISYGDTVIEGNVARGNGIDDNRGGIEVSISEGVTIRDNVVVDNGAGIVVTHDEERLLRETEPEEPLLTASISIINNFVEPERRHGMIVNGRADYAFDEVVFAGNIYCEAKDEPFRWRGQVMPLEGWLPLHPLESVSPECPTESDRFSGFEDVLKVAEYAGTRLD